VTTTDPRPTRAQLLRAKHHLRRATNGMISLAPQQGAVLRQLAGQLGQDGYYNLMRTLALTDIPEGRERLLDVEGRRWTLALAPESDHGGGRAE
jgi:hypothetical protein